MLYIVLTDIDIVSSAYGALWIPYTPIKNAFLMKGVYAFLVGGPANLVALVIVHETDITTRILSSDSKSADTIRTNP